MQAVTAALLDDEPPCWGMDGIPLLPPEWDAHLGDIELPIRPTAKRGLPRGRCLYCQTGWFSIMKWSRTPINAVTEFAGQFFDDPEADWVNTPVIDGRFRRSTDVRQIPFLLDTLAALDAHGISDTDLADLLTSCTVLELRQITESISAALDLTMTTRSWTVQDSAGWLSVHTAKVPAKVDEAFSTAQVRYVRQRGFGGRYGSSAHRWSEAIAGRIGLRPGGSITLEKAGELVGVTRERIRQLTDSVDFETPHYRRWPTAEWLDAAHRQLVDGLNSDGISEAAVPPITELDLCRLLEQYGYSDVTNLRIRLEDPDEPDLYGLTTRDITRTAWKLSEYTGFLRSSDLIAELRTRAPDAPRDGIEDLVDRSVEMSGLPNGYLYQTSTRAGVVVETCQRMLAWVEALTVPELRDGLARRFRYRGLPPLPPLDVIVAFLDRHPDFIKNGDLVRAARQQPIKDTTVAAWIIQQIRDSGLDVIHRTVLHDAARQAGLNTTSVQMFSAYSELLEPLGEGCITIVGTRPEPWAIEEARLLASVIRVSTRIEQTRESDSGPVLRIRVGNGLRDSGVLPISVPLGRRLANREFDLFADDIQRGHLKLSGRSALVGLRGALDQLEVMPGDQVTLSIEMASLCAVVTVPTE